MLLAALSLVLWLMFPIEKKRQEISWQLPIEPPGVTIISHTPESAYALTQTNTADIPKEAVRPVAEVVTQAPVAPPSQVSDQSPSLAQVEVRKVIERWSAAWSARNMSVYLMHYGQAFVPAGHLSRTDWEKTRHQRILTKKQIFHEVRHLEIVVNADSATAMFDQIYTADQIRQLTRKTLRFQKEGVEWRIISESSN